MINSQRSMAPSHKRTRGGCLVCRARKIKCDEAKPVCGQCSRSKRECVPPDGPFRHEHNASINGTTSDKKKLEKFYKYRQEYDTDHYFLPIPEGELRWHYIDNPYEDESLEPWTPQLSLASSKKYQQVAATSLAALSSHQLAHLTASHSRHFMDPFQSPAFLPSNSFESLSTHGRHNDVESLLNPSPNIDPDLDLPVLDSHSDMHHDFDDSKHVGLLSSQAAEDAALFAALAEGAGGPDIKIQ